MNSLPFPHLLSRRIKSGQLVSLLFVALIVCIANVPPAAGEKLDPPYPDNLSDADETFITRRHPFLSDVCVIIITYHKNHPFSVRAAHNTWLRDVRHAFYTDLYDPKLPTVVGEEPPRDKVPKPKDMNNYGDFRWLQMVRHANVSCRPFKWLLVGDDDTYFALTHTMEVLRKIDEKVPLYLGLPHPPAIGSKHPGRARCHKDTSVGYRQCCNDVTKPCEVVTPKWFDTKVRRCFVTPVNGTKWYRTVPKDTHGAVEYYPRPAAWHYGGAGAVLSVGLLDRINVSAWDDCDQKFICGGGDLLLGGCIAHTAGLAITDIREHGGFYPLMPRGKNFSQALEERLSYHKVNARMMRQLHEAELQMSITQGWAANVTLGCIKKGPACKANVG